MDWPWRDYSAADAKTLFSGEISPAILDHAQNSHPATLDGVMRLSSERRTPRPAPPNEAGGRRSIFERAEVTAYLQQQSITTRPIAFRGGPAE